MGWNSACDILDEVWPVIYDLIVDPDDRVAIYSTFVQSLENHDADTLDEAVLCTSKDVDPALVQVLVDRGHLDADWEEYR